MFNTARLLGSGAEFDASRRANPSLTAVLLLAALFLCRPAEADFSVRSVDAQWIDGLYQLDARLGLFLSPQAIEALQKGVTLTIVVDIEVERARRYWLNDSVATLEQRYELSYHALSDQYVVSSANTGVQLNFPSLQSALDVLGTVVDLPVLDRQLIDDESVYRARLRVRLDINALPPPLRVMAYVWPGWGLSSDWHTWTLNK